MRHLLASVVTCFALAAAPAIAQEETSCSDLTVTNDTALTFALTGAQANAGAFMLIGTATATQAVTLGSTTFNLGVAMPALPVYLGQTDAAGAVSVSCTAPTLPEGKSITFYMQAGTFSFDMETFALAVCESDVESVTLGS